MGSLLLPLRLPTGPARAMRLPQTVTRTSLAVHAPRRCFCNAPKVVDTWEDPRGTYEVQRRKYKAELSQMRKQYAAEVAEKQASVAKAHAEKMEMLRKANLKVKDPELVACVCFRLPCLLDARGSLLTDVCARSQKKLERELQERQFREMAAAYKARKREAGEHRYDQKRAERLQKHKELIDHMATMESTWIQPDEVEERIIHALDNPIRIDV